MLGVPGARHRPRPRPLQNLVLALCAGAIMRIYLTRDLWARLAASATVHNLAAVEAMVGQGQMASAIGEGFADSIDIGGF